MAHNRGRARAKADRISVWASFTAQGQTVTNAAVLLGVANAALLALRPFTIVRTRGLFHLSSDQSATSEVSSGAMGAIVVEEEAADAGIASLPTPVSEPNASYFLYEPYIHELQVSTAVGFESPAGTNIFFDSKAMRKVGISQDIVIVAENTGSPGSLITIEGRMLIKLH